MGYVFVISLVLRLFSVGAVMSRQWFWLTGPMVHCWVYVVVVLWDLGYFGSEMGGCWFSELVNLLLFR